MVPDKILQKAIEHNAVCDRLRAEGYSIQGCNGKKFDKCYFAKGKAPYVKIVGYIDAETLEVVFTD